MMQNHPNATVAGLVGALTILLVWILSMFSIDVPQTAASAITTVITALVLLAGRRNRQPAPDPQSTSR